MALEARPRLLVVSSRARNKVGIQKAVLPNVRLVEYSFDSTTLDELSTLIDKAVGGRKVSSMAFVIHSSEKELFICAPGEAKLSLRSIVNDHAVRAFFKKLVKEVVDMQDWSVRIDFLATYMAEQVDGGLLAKELEQLLDKCQVGLSKNLEGSDIQVIRNNKAASTGGGRFLTVGEMYFDLPTLKNFLSQVGKVSKDGHMKLVDYERVRVVGNGAFGSAVLYRRKEDGLLSIIKEIKMLQLSASDRQMALNEVKVLATLDHPNIVSYYDSFERDGVLMIEMEFADDGNLAEFLSQRKTRIEEVEILEKFSQLVSAIRYMHSRNVLHRDLKTANIFLTKEGMVKIGDFGISKVMSTQQVGAVTVVGTPYYISPEMCEGKIYDEKSDVWALGCIAYEMACLQRPFDASNLHALVNKIVRGQYPPIRGDYSPRYKHLIRDLLQKDPEFRPTASEVLLQRLPEIQSQFTDRYYLNDPEFIINEELEKSGNNRSKTKFSRPKRSVLYFLKAHESSISMTPIQLPPRAQILQISVSNTHMIALTSDLLVYTWGEGRRGQLGHSEVEVWRSRPRCVDALRTKSITRVGAGDGFSVFTSDNGIVMTCGDGSFGALGHDDWQSLTTPRLVETLLHVDVSAMACGPEHVVVVSGKGDVYSWGRGEGGRLGHDSEEDCCIPKHVKLNTEEIYIVNVKCSGNATILLSREGHLYACGGNRYNRLAMDEAKVSFVSNHVEKVLVPTRIKAVKVPIVDLAMGPNHTMCLTTQRKLVAFGRNSEGQLGLGHSRSVSGPTMVKSMASKESSLVSCGDTFTLVGTNENVVYLWGTRLVSLSPPSSWSSRLTSDKSFGSRLAGRSLSEAEFKHMMMQKERSNPTSQQRPNGSQAMGGTSSHNERSLAGLSTTELLHNQNELSIKDVVLEPQEILALYASPSQVEKGETVMLSLLLGHGQDTFAVIDTTCPVAKSNQPDPSAYKDEVPPADLFGEKNDRADVKGDADLEVTAEWIKNEIAEADHILDKPMSAKSQENKSRPTTSNKLVVVDKAASEYQKKLELELNRRQQEIRMEAENAIRERERALNDEVMRLREELEQHQRTSRSRTLSNDDKAFVRSGMCAIM